MLPVSEDDSGSDCCSLSWHLGRLYEDRQYVGGGEDSFIDDKIFDMPLGW